MRLALFLSIAALFQAGLSPLARAQESPGPEVTPQLLKPKFPLEPDKQAEIPIRPETYRAGPDAPPAAATAMDDIPISRRLDRDQRWRNTLALGWFIANQTARHQFTGLSTTFADVRRSNSNALSLSGRFDLRPPSSIFTGLVAVEGTTGRADVKVDRSTVVPLTRFDVQDLRTRAGVRMRITRAASAHALLLGGDAGFGLASFTTLNPAQTALDVDRRMMLTATPRIAYQYAPFSNWSLEVEGGYALPITASGEGDVKAYRFRRIETEARAIRYLAESDAIGFAFQFADEKVTWTRSAPSALSDEVADQDLRIQIFWHHDL